jgi:Flp pilus assembly protein TadG
MKRFLKEDRGSVTIEFVLWVPIFAFLLMLTADASFMYLTITRMENAARDAARRVSIGQYDTTTIDDYVLSELTDGPYAVSADCSTNEYACVQISRSVNSIVTFGVLQALVGQTVGAETKMRLEPGVSI